MKKDPRYKTLTILYKVYGSYSFLNFLLWIDQQKRVYSKYIFLVQKILCTYNFSPYALKTQSTIVKVLAVNFHSLFQKTFILLRQVPSSTLKNLQLLANPLAAECPKPLEKTLNKIKGKSE